MTEEREHYCPGCGKPQRIFLRYPWYFCQDCLDEAVDGDGRRLVFGNVSFSGGLSWGYADDPDMRDDRAVEGICLIRGRPVTVGEARFGGVVAEPVNSSTGHMRVFERNSVVLTGGPVMEAARQRLVPRNDKR